ncbi:MAG TPA: FecR domain-containing protein [Bacteroidales bacterium]|nr:FecR domain-containing protein [Bacteroidales bacterium]
MSLNEDIVYELIVKSLSGQLDADESRKLDLWMNEDASHRQEYNDYVTIWERSNKMALSSAIDVSASLEKAKSLAGIRDKRFRLAPILYQVAAILILALLLALFLDKARQPKAQISNDKIVYQQIKAPYGTQANVELPDGTFVNLNSGSTLRFPASFNGMDTRQVQLTGEAMFSVEKDPKKPFIVNTNNIQIKVLGTVFNVNAYPSNTAFSVALIEGSIEIQRKSSKGSDEVFKMQKNQICRYDKEKGQFSFQTENNLEQYTAWTEGKILFYNDNVNTVIEKLENWYNVNIEIADTKIEKYRFTGVFVDEPLEQVLNILSMTSDMKYQSIPAEKLSDNTYTKRKILLKSK